MKSVNFWSFVPLIVAISLAGCSNPEKAALESFQPVVNYFANQTNLSDISFDVEKSDSLVSPYNGMIKFHDDDEIFVCRFALQSNKWVHKSIEANLDEEAEKKVLTEIDNDTNIINDDVRATCKEQTIRLKQDLIEMKKHNLNNELASFLGCDKIEQ